MSNRLAAYGVKAAAMHGDRTQNQRNQALAGFRDGRYRVLVATDVAARGIHVDSVAHVVNFDLPQAPQDFIHRVGRTGRAGQRGSASTFSVRGERSEIKRIERECKITLMRSQVSPDTLKALAEMPMQERLSAPVVVSRPPSGHHNNRGRNDGRPENGGGFRKSFSHGSKRSGPRANSHSSFATAK